MLTTHDLTITLPSPSPSPRASPRGPRGVRGGDAGGGRRVAGVQGGERPPLDSRGEESGPRQRAR